MIIRSLTANTHCRTLLSVKMHFCQLKRRLGSAYLIVMGVIISACTLTGTLYDDINPEPLPHPADLPQMTLKSNKLGEVSIEIMGAGNITIDWGDGSEVATHTISNNTSFQRVYANDNLRTITITGENITRINLNANQISHIDLGEITSLVHLLCYDNNLDGMLDLSANTLLQTLLCQDNLLTGLNVSGCAELRILNCGTNRITNLTMFNNTELEYLDCSFNSMESSSLSILLSSLHGNEISDGKTIFINDNPGTETSLNKDIAKNNGWEVIEIKND